MSVEIIAEIGCEHGGSVDEFRRIADAVAATGQVQWIKWQMFRADTLVSRTADPEQYAMLEALEFTAPQHLEAKKHVEALGLRPLVSVFSEQDVWIAESLGFTSMKIGSGELTDERTVKAAAKAVRWSEPHQPYDGLFISTGMSTTEEIRTAARWVSPRVPPGSAAVWFACTSAYPCEEEAAHVSRMDWLSNYISNSVGYSDHTLSSVAATVAVALGARYIEKHVTTGKGPDAGTALDLYAFDSWCADVRLAEAAVGSRQPRLRNCERETFKKARKSIYMLRDVAAGQPQSKDDFALLRPWRDE